MYQGGVTMKGKTCCFTGPNIKAKEFSQRYIEIKNCLREEVTKMISQCGVRHFICGIDRGINTLAAEIVLAMKAVYPVTLECVISYEEQAKSWSEDNRNRCFSIVERSDYETMLQARYTFDCNQKRDRYIVNHSDYIIAVVPGNCSTELETVRYAQEKGIIINMISI